jgi:hypothetical protein
MDQARSAGKVNSSPALEQRNHGRGDEDIFLSLIHWGAPDAKATGGFGESGKHRECKGGM